MKIRKSDAKTQIEKGCGFTLVEVLVAMVILSVGLLGMAALSVGIAQSNRISRDISIATTLAQDKLEDIRRLSYSNISNETKSACNGTFSNYNREVAVASDFPTTGMKTVTVTVYWDSDNHDVELKSIFIQ